MKIKLLVSRAGVGLSQNRGDEIDVGDAEALRMIAAGQALPIDAQADADAQAASDAQAAADAQSKAEIDAAAARAAVAPEQAVPQTKPEKAVK